MPSPAERQEYLGRLATESGNPALAELDTLETLERLRLMNAEDARVAQAVAAELAVIAKAVQMIVRSFRAGGRLIYVGAGTSGRLAVLDAAECPPTFGTPPALVVAIIAGGDAALRHPVEGAEDDAAAGARSIVEREIDERDTVIGVSASGRAPFVLGALECALARGAATIALVNNRASALERIARLTIAPVVGPEAVAGSTRLKAGTAQKMVMNLLSTNAMIETGRTYGNLMVDVQVTNEKLRARALRILQEVTEASPETVERTLAAADGSVKLAILMLETGLDAGQARDLLTRNEGFLRRALGAHSS